MLRFHSSLSLPLSTQTHKHTNTQTRKHTNTQTHKHTNTLARGLTALAHAVEVEALGVLGRMLCFAVFYMSYCLFVMFLLFVGVLGRNRVITYKS